MQDINYKNIIREIKPSKQEIERVKKLSKRIVDVINESAASMDVKADAMLVGSVAKGTWLAGNADIDILIKFPIDTDEKYLKKFGLKIGHESIKKMEGISEERYASHPYVTGYIEGYYVDFVPCYNIKNADELKSAVDRTLLHTAYIKSNLKQEQQDEVVLLKKFMESVGTYGSEFKVGGFAGYLCEMLILNYGSFTETLKNAAVNWNCGFSFDLEDYGTSNLFNDPMVAVDPVDKNRNVAAALTLQKMSEFIVASENFISNPSEEYFASKDIIIDPIEITERFNLRGTKTFLISFKPPDIPADAIYPQIKKTEKSIVRVAESEGFSIFGSRSWTDEKEVVLILLEFETWNLPRVKKHFGPHIWIREHQKRFLEKHSPNAWVEEDRWVVDIERDYIKAEILLSDLMTGKKSGYLKFGKHLKKKIMNEHKIMDLNIFLESDKAEENVLEFLYYYLNNGELLFR